jgi:hypothetical protein
MQHLDLSDAALIKELADITGNDRYPFSARIQTLTRCARQSTGRSPPSLLPVALPARGLCVILTINLDEFQIGRFRQREIRAYTSGKRR